jgi:hypothetical protein
VDHFLHRLLSESARSLWTNAYLFAETNSIEKQKNLRQVSALLQEAVLQAIRGLLPVKSILREYLHDDEEEELGAEAGSSASAASSSAAEPDEVSTATTSETPTDVSGAPSPAPSKEEAPASTASTASTAPTDASTAPTAPTAPTDASAPEQPTIVIDTKPSVSFSQEHVFFDSNTLEENEIHDIPFAEAENREDDEAEEAEEAEEGEDYDSLTITDDILPMEADEIV